MNSLTYEEAVHKLMKVNIQEGQEVRRIFPAVMTAVYTVYLDRALQHGHRVLFPRAVLFTILRPHWREVQ